MKRYVIKGKLSKEEKYLFDTVMSQITNFIRFRRQVLIDNNILVVKEYEKNID